MPAQGGQKEERDKKKSDKTDWEDRLLGPLGRSQIIAGNHTEKSQGDGKNGLNDHGNVLVFVSDVCRLPDANKFLK